MTILCPLERETSLLLRGRHEARQPGFVSASEVINQYGRRFTQNQRNPASVTGNCNRNNLRARVRDDCAGLFWSGGQDITRLILAEEIGVERQFTDAVNR